MTDPRSVLQKNLGYEKRLYSAADTIHKAQLCELLLMLSQKGEIIRPDELAEAYMELFSKNVLCADMLFLSEKLCSAKKYPDLPRKDVSVAFMKGNASSLAMEALCNGMDPILPVEFTDFRSPCEAVINDIANFCILPVYSSREGYYSAFNKLINAYDLKICRYARIARQDDDEEIRFALLSKELYGALDCHHALFSFTEDSDLSLSELIDAFKCSDARVIGIQSSPLEYNMDKLSHKIELRLNSLRPEALLFFLEAALPNHTVCGLY